MVICFSLSVMFFMNSGIVDEQTGQINQDKAIEILSELDKIPFIDTGINEEDLSRYSHLP